MIAQLSLKSVKSPKYCVRGLVHVCHFGGWVHMSSLHWSDPPPLGQPHPYFPIQAWHRSAPSLYSHLDKRFRSSEILLTLIAGHRPQSFIVELVYICIFTIFILEQYNLLPLLFWSCICCLFGLVYLLSLYWIGVFAVFILDWYIFCLFIGSVYLLSLYWIGVFAVFILDRCICCLFIELVYFLPFYWIGVFAVFIILEWCICWLYYWSGTYIFAAFIILECYICSLYIRL